MYNSIFYPSRIHPTPLNLDILQHWINWLNHNSIAPTWMSGLADPTLGLERIVDMVWLSVLMPATSENTAPAWRHGFKEIANIYQTGIDLLDRRTIEHMDVADVKAMWPQLSDSTTARTFLLRYQSYIDVRRQLGHPAHDLHSDAWFKMWIDKLSVCDPELLPSVLDTLPSLYTLSENLRLPFRLPTNLLTPSAIHALWSSGLLDPGIDTQSTVESSQTHTPDVERIAQSAGWALDRLSEHTQLSSVEIVLRLHGFIEAKLGSKELRPWLWT